VPAQNRKAYLRLTIIVAIAAIAGAALFEMPASPVTASPGPVPEPTRTRRRAVRVARPARYSQFPHSAKAHRLECNTCHKFPSPNWKQVRSEADAFPDITDYPRHENCVGCHKQQFFKGSPPAVCSICHTNPGPRNSARWPFPNPREIFDKSAKGRAAESDFAVTFPHDKHIEIVAAANRHSDTFIYAAFTREEGEESCVVCHKTMVPQGDSEDEYVTKPPANIGDAFWLKKGMFKSAPIGHTTCFTCHNTETGVMPDGQSCATCHQLRSAQPRPDFDPKLWARTGVADKVMLDAWRTRQSAGAFRHEFASHAELACSTCHNVLTMNTADPSTRKVSIAACAMCHATATSDDGGALNYEIDERKANPAFQCVKCHITFGKQPVPESHIKAIRDAAGK